MIAHAHPATHLDKSDLRWQMLRIAFTAWMTAEHNGRSMDYLRPMVNLFFPAIKNITMYREKCQNLNKVCQLNNNIVSLLMF